MDYEASMKRESQISRRFVALIALVSTLLMASGSTVNLALASEERRSDRSRHFLIHTDLSQEKTDRLLERMEQTLEEVSDYWGRPARGLIECYVIDDLANWPDHALPHPLSRLIVKRIGGVTLVDRVGAGIRTRTKVIVLAAAREGVAEHEVVHAYCGQVFGVTGPAWYREGIAQVFAYALGKPPGLHCPDELAADLKSRPFKPIQEVIQGAAFNQRLYRSVVRKMNQHQDLVGLIPVSSWNESDVQELDKLKQQYAWSWLTCHLLYHNPNYQARFESLGRAYLAERQERFGELFGPIAKELAFEYEFTLQRFEPGYRVDLCAWEWDKRWRCSRGGRHVGTRVEAARGYQASGLLVKQTVPVEVCTRGQWKTAARASNTGAAGSPRGFGQLEGIVLSEYRLSHPFPIGDRSTFHPPCDGQLYLRCRDHWNSLADNEGSLVVSLRSAR